MRKNAQFIDVMLEKDGGEGLQDTFKKWCCLDLETLTVAKATDYVKGSLFTGIQQRTLQHTTLNIQSLQKWSHVGSVNMASPTKHTKSTMKLTLTIDQML